MKYRNRARGRTLHAIEWTGKNIADIATFCDDPQVTSMPGTTTLTLDRFGGLWISDMFAGMALKEGDWLVCSSQDYLERLSSRDFHWKYEPVSTAHQYR